MAAIKITGNHPAADLFPEPTAAEFEALKADMKVNGQIDPISVANGKIVDGRSRYRACLELRIEPRFEDVSGKSEAELVALSVSRNLHRRHLTQQQRRELIAKLLKATPEKSNRQIAELAKVKHDTVGAVRRQMESTGQIGQLSKTVGADGRARTAKPKPKPAAKSKPKSGAASDPRNDSLATVERKTKARIYGLIEQIAGRKLPRPELEKHRQAFAEAFVISLQGVASWIDEGRKTPRWYLEPEAKPRPEATS
jgi:ParB-like chromosome segregation protein Spo0J